MDTKDITKEQLETLVLVRCLEEFITDEHENLSSLSEVIWTLEESLSTEEHKQLVKDICILTENGYLRSDATEEHIKTDTIPEVNSITIKGTSILDEWEQEFKKNNSSKKEENITVAKSYSFLNNLTFNINLSGTARIFSMVKRLKGVIYDEKKSFKKSVSCCHNEFSSSRKFSLRFRRGAK